MIEKEIEINSNLVKKSRTDIPKLMLNIKPNMDYINTILTRSYGIKYKKWRKVLKKEYIPANFKLFLSENCFHLDKNAWVNYIALFVEILTREFIKIASKKLKKYKFPKNNTTDKKGKVVIQDIGVIYDSLLNMKIPASIKTVFKYFQDIQKRRNHTPTSHSYDKKTLAHSKNVLKKEQNELIGKLKDGLKAYIVEVDKLI